MVNGSRRKRLGTVRAHCHHFLSAALPPLEWKAQGLQRIEIAPHLSGRQAGFGGQVPAAHRPASVFQERIQDGQALVEDIDNVLITHGTPLRSAVDMRLARYPAPVALDGHWVT